MGRKRKQERQRALSIAEVERRRSSVLFQEPRDQPNEHRNETAEAQNPFRYVKTDGLRETTQDLHIQPEETSTESPRASGKFKSSLRHIFGRRKTIHPVPEVPPPIQSVRKRTADSERLYLTFDRLYLANKIRPTLTDRTEATEATESCEEDLQSVHSNETSVTGPVNDIEKKEAKPCYAQQRPLSGRYPRIGSAGNVQPELHFKKRYPVRTRPMRSQTEPVPAPVPLHPKPVSRSRPFNTPQSGFEFDFGSRASSRPRAQTFLPVPEATFESALSREVSGNNSQYHFPAAFQARSKYPPSIARVIDNDTFHHAASPPRREQYSQSFPQSSYDEQQHTNDRRHPQFLHTSAGLGPLTSGFGDEPSNFQECSIIRRPIVHSTCVPKEDCFADQPTDSRIYRAGCQTKPQTQTPQTPPFTSRKGKNHFPPPARHLNNTVSVLLLLLILFRVALHCFSC